ncbi:MAG: protein kinase [Bacillota bacterium]|nr:protein kinase [Bacillota bacterium]
MQSYEPLWGQWRLGRCLYRGSSSAVFELRRERCDKELTAVVKAVEICPEERDRLPELFARAVDEIEKMEQLSACSNIVAARDDDIRELRDADGELTGYDVLIRMDRLSCVGDLIRDGEVLPVREVKKLGLDLCRALSYAHSLGFVHRDIKPANIYRNAGGEYLLGDFGVSGRSLSGGQLQTITGTTAYMAPEVALGESYDSRADIYSLGVVLYQLLNHNYLPLTGESSTYSERTEAISRRRRGVKLPPPSGGEEDAALVRAVLQACRADREERFSSAEALAEALAGREEMEWAGKAKRRMPAVVGALCLAAGLLAGLLIPWAGLTPATGGEGVYPLEEYPSDSRYEVVRGNMSWEDANIYCTARGGHLASITSRSEEEKIIALLEEEGLSAVWLGANNRNSARGFEWVTGERFSYAAWGLNEPNDTDGVEHYLMLMKRDGVWVWNDSRDDGLDNFIQEQVGFVCEWDDDEEEQ